MTDDLRVEAGDGRGAVPPGPKGPPLVGPLLDLRRDVLGTMHDAMVRFGDVVRFAGGPLGRFGVRIYGLYHPDDVERMRTSGDDVYSKQDPSSVEIRAALGDGLLTSEGEVWRRQRRIVDPLFTAERVAGWFPVVASEANRLVAAWRDTAVRGAGVDLHRDTTEVARRVIARVVFGPDAEQMLPVFSERLAYLSRRAFDRGVSPLRIPDSWPTPGNRKAARAKRALREAVDDVVARRRRQPIEGDDLVSLLLEAPDPAGGPGLDDDEVGQQVPPFLLAGGDQPATAMAFVLHLLGHHPEAQRRVHDELDAVLGTRPLTVADVEALPRVTAAVKEAMRLYPPAYGLPRRAEKDRVYRGYLVPAGAQAACMPWVTHRHPGFWDEPERFDPERFAPEGEAARHPYAYFAFGGGPHGCVGVHLAMLETVVVTATVLQAYRVLTEPGRVPVATGVTLRPERAMPAQVVAR